MKNSNNFNTFILLIDQLIDTFIAKYKILNIFSELIFFNNNLKQYSKFYIEKTLINLSNK